MIRLIMFLVESEYNMWPKENELGNSNNIFEIGKFSEYISRNIRLALANIDMVRLYVILTVQNNETIFKIMGCLSVLWIKIVSLEFDGSVFDLIHQHKEKDMKTVGNLACFWENYSEYKISNFDDLSMKEIIYIYIWNRS